MRALRRPHHPLCAGLVAASCLAWGCNSQDSGERSDLAARSAAPADRENAAPPGAPAPAATAPAHGFGDAIAWRGLEEGLREAASADKALMLVIHADWCSKCEELKAAFFDPKIITTSRDLVMVNLDQDRSPESRLYAPDGVYVPRVIFLGADGEHLRELRNRQRPNFHYFFRPQDDLLGVMREAVAHRGS